MALLLSGCRGERPGGDPALVLDVGISPTPPTVGPARLLITLQDTLGNPLEAQRVWVEGNMSHAGMVPVQDTAVAQNPGLYVVPAFEFTMAGDWVLTVEALLPDGRKAIHQKRTDVVGGVPGIHESEGLTDDTTTPVSDSVSGKPLRDPGEGLR